MGPGTPARLNRLCRNDFQPWWLDGNTHQRSPGGRAMPEQEQQDPAEQEPEGQEPEAQQEDSGDAQRSAEAQRISKVNRENASLRRRLKELEDRDKTDMERATESAQAATARAEKAERELMRVRVAADKGLTLAQSRRLVGDTVDELTADADALLEDLKPSGAAAIRKPQENLRGGSEPDEPVLELDPNKLAEQIRAAR